MKGVCWCNNLSKLKEPLPEVQSRLFKNQGAHFMFHSLPVRADTHQGIEELRIKN
jgi:hypothetical protein